MRGSAIASSALLAGAWLAAVAATPPQHHPDFSGTWERYPPPGEKADPRYAPSAIPTRISSRNTGRSGRRARRRSRSGSRKASRRATITSIASRRHAGDDDGHVPDGSVPAADQINITQEAFNQTRRIYMNQKLPKWDEVDPSFYGASVGHWEGDTLVIETTGIKDNVRFRWTPHSDAMKITERLHLLAPDILQDQITVEDDYLEKPWTYSYSFRRMKDYKLQEYVCEDNREYVDDQGNQRVHLEGTAAAH